MQDESYVTEGPYEDETFLGMFKTKTSLFD